MRAALALSLCLPSLGCSIISATDLGDLPAQVDAGADADAEPSGDDCTEPRMVVGSASLAGNTSLLQNDVELGCAVGTEPAADAILALVIDEASDLSVNSFGSDFDTVLAVRRDCAAPSSEIACANDANASGTTRIVHRNLAAGTYYLVLDGNRALLSGAYSLAVNTTPAANELSCENALDVTGGAAVWGRTSGPGRSRSPCGGDGSPEEVFTFSLDSPTEITVHTVGSSFDTVLYLRQGRCDGGSTLVCDDDSGGGNQSRIETTLPAGRYHLFVDGQDGASGSYRLVVYFNAAVP
jgi:hypothetical protein